jgi:hypothetical protein
MLVGVDRSANLGRAMALAHGAYQPGRAGWLFSGLICAWFPPLIAVRLSNEGEPPATKGIRRFADGCRCFRTLFLSQGLAS